VYDEVGDPVEFRRVAIEDHEARALAFREDRKGGCGIHDQRRSDGQEEIAGFRELPGMPHCRLGHGLTERDRGRFHDPSASRTHWRVACNLELNPDRCEFVAQSAGETGRVGSIPMQLDNLFRRDARGLVESVDVLSDDRGHLPALHEGRERDMPATRQCAATLVVDGEFPVPGFTPRLLAAEKCVERNRLVPSPGAARRTKIGNSALGGDPCTREAENRSAPREEILECGNVTRRGGGSQSHVSRLATLRREALRRD
jgi:hypothetical protein